MEETNTVGGSGVEYSSTYEGALTAMKSGKKVTRAGWNGKELGHIMYTAAQFPNAGSMNTNPYLYMVVDNTEVSDKAGSGTTSRTPWHPSNIDMFANDWSVLE